MAVNNLPDDDPPADDTALLTAALDHAWNWYDAQQGRILQVINYFLVASAILITAYTAAINGSHNVIAVIISAAGLGLTALAALVGVRETKRGAAAESPLTELQRRVGDRLGIESIRMATVRPERWQNFASEIIVFGLPAALNLAALAYALVQAITHARGQAPAPVQVQVHVHVP